MRENAGVADKMRAGFGVDNAPHGDALNYAYQRLEVDEVQEIICCCMETLMRKKALQRYRLLSLYYTVAIDGTGVLTFRERHCPHCLAKTLRNSETLYYHPVLEAKVVTPNGFALSLTPALRAGASVTEFVENADLLQDKQDCELKAFYRLSKRLKARFPRLPLCLLLDGLFAGGPTFKICEDHDWKNLIVLQERDLLNLHRDRLRTAKNQAKRILEVWHNLSLSSDEFLQLEQGNFQIRFDTS